jgi:cytochrome c peroxidase
MNSDLFRGRMCMKVFCLILVSVPAFAQALGSLKTIGIPKPSNLDKYVRDEKTLLVLGKALFWDVQVGSDGQTACATCHFHAGADHRVQNQLCQRDRSAGSL